MRSLQLVLSVAWLAVAAAFTQPAASALTVQRHSIHPVAMAKGFGPPPPPPKPKPKKSEASVARDQAGKDFDALKASGAPEYMVSVRTVGAKNSDWMPVGGIAVPRSNSVDQAVSMAIFNNEDQLLKAAFRAYPKLKTSEEKFEYRLRDFPDDEIKVASQEKTEVTTNPLMQWFNMLDSPLNK